MKSVWRFKKTHGKIHGTYKFGTGSMQSPENSELNLVEKASDMKKMFRCI